MQVTPAVHMEKEGEETADGNATLNDYLIP
jgi:hypothetical protein